MFNEELTLQPEQRTQLASWQLQSAALVAFRHRYLILTSFVGILLGSIALCFLRPPEYRTETKLLFRNNRVEPTLGAGADTPLQAIPPVTPEEVNSEVELLKSYDVLRSAVISTGLDRSSLLHPRESQAQRQERAIRGLDKRVQVEAAKHSNVIVLSLSSSDPEGAAKILNTLTTAYLDRRSEMRNAAGQYKFFDDQVDRYRKQLAAIQQQSQQLPDVLPHASRDSTLVRLAELRTNLAQTEVTISETEQRLRTLGQQESSIPPRLVTQRRRTENAQLLQQLKGNLSSMELRRDELLAKYQPDYRPVQDLDQQIADLRATVEKEESAPLRDETTDENPTYVLLRSELEKARADLSGLKARAAALAKGIATVKETAKDLEQQSVVEADLQREEKAAEDSYLLYLRKREDARIADALDRRGMVSVEVVQAARVPALPENSKASLLLGGLALALFVSVAAVFGAEMLNNSYRTPQEVISHLNLPVLAAIPHPTSPELIEGLKPVRRFGSGASS